jgi:lipid-binding SYLF domain-containing protein
VLVKELTDNIRALRINTHSAGMNSQVESINDNEMKTEKPTAYPAVVIKTFLFLVFPMMLSFTAGNLWAQTAEEINSDVYACLSRFYNQTKGGREIAAMAEGVLVMPGAVKAGRIVGGEYGGGALRVGGKTVSYYRLTSGSIGLQVGGVAKDIVILFMGIEPLEQFQASKEWEVGIDGNVALANIGSGKRVNFITMNEPIIGFVIDANGLMADESLKGAKFTKIKPK